MRHGTSPNNSRVQFWNYVISLTALFSVISTDASTGRN